jgi:hypothetical protein
MCKLCNRIRICYEALTRVIPRNEWIEIPFEVKMEIAGFLHNEEAKLKDLDTGIIDSIVMDYFMGFRRGVIWERAGQEVVGEALGPGPERLEF